MTICRYKKFEDIGRRYGINDYFCAVNTDAPFMLHHCFFHGVPQTADRLTFHPFKFFVK